MLHVLPLVQLPLLSLFFAGPSLALPKAVSAAADCSSGIASPGGEEKRDILQLLQQLVLTVLQLRHSSFGHCWAAVGAGKSQRDPRPLTNRLNSFVAAARHTRPRTRARTSSRAHPSVRPSLQLPQLSSSSSLSIRPSLPLARFSFSPALPRAVSLICSFPFSSLLFLLLPHSHFSPSFIFFASLIHLFIRSLSLSPHPSFVTLCAAV